MTDTSKLMALAQAIASSSPKIRAYALEQAAVTISQEAELRALLARVAALEQPVPAPEPTPTPPPASVWLNDLGEFGRPAKDWAVAANWLADSPMLLERLRNAASSAVVALGSYGVAFYHATPTDPTMTVRNLNGWGTLPTGGSFRCPSNAQPATGTDRHLVAVQPDGSAFELWKATRTSALSWDAGSVSMAASGTYSYPIAGCRGSSFTLASGCLAPEDVAAGRIGHALAIVLPSAAVRRAYMWPSNDTDGQLADGIPEGARIVLDPAADLSALTGITKLIAQALKDYGALVVDKTSGGDVSFPAIAPQSWTAIGQTSPWVALGLSGYPNVTGLLNLLPKCRIENQPIKAKT